MSPYERRPRSNVLGGDETRLPHEESSTLGKGTLDTGGSIGSAVAGHSAGATPTHEVERGYGQTTEVEVYANQRLNLTKLGRPMEERPRFRTVPGKSGRTGL